MKFIRKQYLYHDEFVETIKNLNYDEEALYKPSISCTQQQFIDSLAEKQTHLPDVPEPLLKHRYYRITHLAHDLAYRTTSNLTVELTQGYRLFLKYEGDVMMIHERSIMQCFLRLLGECDSFHIFPSGSMFQLMISYDLRLLEN